MGLYAEMLWPFLGWMLLLCVVGCIVIKIVTKFIMYDGPEDEEIWEDGKEHFAMEEAKPDLQKS